MRKWIMLITGLIVLATANYAIHIKEQLLYDGQIVLLELAPVDPRSLMQGDYMALRFKLANNIQGNSQAIGRDGRVVLKLDAQRVGEFARLDDDVQLGPDELRMRYRIRNGAARLASNAYFFQEGDAALYQAARYGEFRVDTHGEAILTGLRGKDLAPLGREN